MTPPFGGATARLPQALQPPPHLLTTLPRTLPAPAGGGRCEAPGSRLAGRAKTGERRPPGTRCGRSGALAGTFEPSQSCHASKTVGFTWMGTTRLTPPRMLSRSVRVFDASASTPSRW